jgi:beta-fructofuranosidase
MHSIAPLLLLVALLANPIAPRAGETANPAPPPRPLRDKTLVAWVSPSNLTQRAGSVLTIDDGAGHFDGIVFGELTPRKWMPGSDGFQRTVRDQAAWPEETASLGTFVQVALVYRGDQIALYRDGQGVAQYTMPNPIQSFPAHPLVLFGRRHIDAGDKENSFTGRIRDARIYDRALDQATLAALHPGECAAELTPWAWWSFADEGLREKTGRFDDIKLFGNVRLEAGCLALGGQGATVIQACAGEGAVAVPRKWSFESPVPDEVVRSTRLLRERLLADPYRPGYHFCLPEDMGMPGDPNGAFYYQGRYHLMYLYSRNGSGFCWGHVSSADLLHWRHHPDALSPGGGDEGVFSGGAFVDTDGAAYLSYWMLWGAKGIGLARSTPPAFETWSKLEANPIIHSTEWGVTEVKDDQGRTFCYGSADPSNIWKKDGRYYILTGNLLVLNKLGRATNSIPAEQGDRLYLFASDDLRHWKYMHVFYARNPAWTETSEDNMCPSFLPLPSRPEGGPPSNKHLLLFISHNRGCQFYVGDYRDDRFFPDNHGRMSWVDNTYFAPEALIDGQGRQIMWSWLTDNPPGEKEKGWSGVYGLPRSLWLGPDGTLRFAPVQELERLRQHPRAWSDLSLADGVAQGIEGVPGDSCELDVEFDPGTAKRCGLTVRASPDGAEQTLLTVDIPAGELQFDATRSGQAGRRVLEHAPFALAPGEVLRLRVFIDKSVIEVYANDRQAIGRRVFPARSDSCGLAVFAEGGTARVRRLRAWEMLPANPF